MKQRLPTIAAVLSCVLTLICLSQLAALSGRIDMLQSNLSGQIQRVDSAVQNVDFTVSSQLERGASLLAADRFTYGALDVRNQTVELLCSVTPKEFSPNETAATLYWSGGETPLVLRQGSFTAVLELPLFADTQIERVAFSQNGVLRTEAIDWYGSPRFEFLPQIYAFLAGSASGGSGSYHREGSLRIDVNSQRPFEVRSVSLIETLDGREVGRTLLTPDDGQPDDGDPNYYSGSYPVDAIYEVPNGSTLELWADVADGGGLHYRLLVDRWSTDGQGAGAPDEQQWLWQGGEAEIYDEEGNALYKPAPPRP